MRQDLDRSGCRGRRGSVRRRCVGRHDHVRGGRAAAGERRAAVEQDRRGHGRRLRRVPGRGLRLHGLRLEGDGPRRQPRPATTGSRRTPPSREAAYQILVHYFPAQAGRPDGAPRRRARRDPGRSARSATGSGTAGSRPHKVLRERADDGLQTPIGSTSSFPTLAPGPGRLAADAAGLRGAADAVDGEHAAVRARERGPVPAAAAAVAAEPASGSTRSTRSSRSAPSTARRGRPTRRRSRSSGRRTSSASTTCLARNIATNESLDLPETARLLAMVNVVGADAMIAMMNAKYHYLFWRPVTAIDPTLGDERRLRPRARASTTATRLTVEQPGLAAAPGDAEPPRVPVGARDDHVGDRRGPHALPRHRPDRRRRPGHAEPLGDARHFATADDLRAEADERPRLGGTALPLLASRPARPRPRGRRLRPRPRLPAGRLERTSDARGAPSTARPGLLLSVPNHTTTAGRFRWLPPPGPHRSRSADISAMQIYEDVLVPTALHAVGAAAPRPPRPPARRGGHRRRVRSRIRDAARRDGGRQERPGDGYRPEPGDARDRAGEAGASAMPRRSTITRRPPIDCPSRTPNSTSRSVNTGCSSSRIERPRWRRCAARFAPGGRMGIAVWADDRAVACLRCPRRRRSGKWPATSSPIAIAAGRGACQTPTRLRELLEESGFDDVRVTQDALPLSFECAAQLRSTLAASAIAADLDALSAQRREQLARSARTQGRRQTTRCTPRPSRTSPSPADSQRAHGPSRTGKRRRRGGADRRALATHRRSANAHSLHPALSCGRLATTVDDAHGLPLAARHARPARAPRPRSGCRCARAGRSRRRAQRRRVDLGGRLALHGQLVHRAEPLDDQLVVGRHLGHGEQQRARRSTGRGSRRGR